MRGLHHQEFCFRATFSLPCHIFVKIPKSLSLLQFLQSPISSPSTTSPPPDAAPLRLLQTPPPVHALPDAPPPPPLDLAPTPCPPPPPLDLRPLRASSRRRRLSTPLRTSPRRRRPSAPPRCPPPPSPLQTSSHLLPLLDPHLGQNPKIKPHLRRSSVSKLLMVVDFLAFFMR